MRKPNLFKMRMRMMSCRIRNFFLLIFTALISSIILICLLGQESNEVDNFQQIVTQKFESLKENLSSEKKLEVDEKYMNLLGFNDEAKRSRRNVNNFKNNSAVPLYIVSAVTRNQLQQAEHFLYNVNSVLPASYKVVLWNLDTTPIYEETDFSLALKQNCNNSRCWVERFSFEEYPEHIRDLSLRAYRPLIIQTMLMRGGCVFWLDIDRKFFNSAKETIEKIMALAINNKNEDTGENGIGIIGWSFAGHPTSSLTHPKLFPYFQTEAENFYFHRMIDPAQLLVCNTELINDKVMKPWIKCTLTKSCISPFGAQVTGCRFDKKPLYRYSGCHNYDSSALNVVLGLTFPLHQPYISRIPLSRPAAHSHLNETLY